MNGINPIWLTVLTFLVTVETGIGTKNVSLDHVFAPAWIPWVQGWSGFLAFIGGALATALSTIQSATPGLFIRRPEAAKAAAIALLVAAVVFAFPDAASAQGMRRIPAGPAPTSGATGPKILSSYLEGKPHLLRIPNPLDLPDPMCITDHPGGNCPVGTEQGGGVTMSGNPQQDLADFFKRGGVTLVRDFQRADQFLSYPCGANAPAGCTKTDALSSSCIEAIIPLAKLVVNGPQANTASPSSTVASDSGNLATVKGADGKSDLTTDNPPVTAADDGVVTAAAKLDVVLIALQGPALQLGCGGWVQAKFQQGTSLAAGVMTFVTTLGIASAPL
ncbi:MAG TPA: hypothetical protein VHB49_10025 [Bradyrhizobium sp.]|nr:hypothetical protein [Bradyrhizobium sp.]